VAQVHPDAQQYPERLHSIGWKVHHFNECCVLSYAHRYHLAHELLGEEDERQLVIRFNKVNCKNVVTAMLLAPVGRDSKGRIVKIKKSEGKMSFPQEHATHFTDNVDMHLLSVGTDVVNSGVDFSQLLIVSS
jgi:hypothetical protein